MSLLRSKSMVEIYGNTPSNIEGTHQVSSAPEGRPLGNINISDPNPALLSRTILLGGAMDMYRATLQGNWPASELLLAVNPSLAHSPITRAGDRALHVAVAMGHKDFVQNLVLQMSEGNIRKLLDGRGYTACCYAAMSGAEEIAHILMENRPSVVTSRDAKKVTLLHKAAFFGKKNMVQYFLNLTIPENLSLQEWFDLLLTVINKKMFEIVEMDGSLAHMRNNEGTALHVLAQLDAPKVKTRTCLTRLCGRTKSAIKYSKTQQDIRLLTERLWAKILELEQDDSITKLMIKPLILHEAAKMGNVELITMLTRSYPDLIGYTDVNGYTMFHIAVIHGTDDVFRLSDQIGTVKSFAEISKDGDGNNILHLAAQLSSTTAKRRAVSPVLELQQKLIWFMFVRANVTQLCSNMTNKDGITPRELFWKQHASLLEKSKAWMRRTTKCCLLIATIFLTMVFTALFTVPGGNNQQTGFPILLKKGWFQYFSLFELFAFVSSSMTIMIFWSILTSSFEEDQFIYILPRLLKAGIIFLLFSFIFTFSAFTSAYFSVIDKSEDSKVLKVGVILLCLEVLAFVLLGFLVIYIRMFIRRSSSRALRSLGRDRLFSSIN